MAFNMKTSGIDALTNLIDQVKTCSDIQSSNPYHYNDTNFDLWKILSALRGPDSGSEGLKDKYTGPIRAWISPEWTKSVGSTTQSDVFTLLRFQKLRTEVDNERNKPPRMDSVAFDHYIGHIQQALDAIIKIERFKESKKEQG